MHRSVVLLWLALLITVGCGPTADVEQERTNLMAVDREWSQSTGDVDRFMSYFAQDASVYPPGMPVTTGAEAIRKTYAEMSSTPGFSLQWTPTKAEVGAGAEIGYTAGTYQSTMGGVKESGKYVTVWKRDAEGSWKVAEDIFNADAIPGGPAVQHVMVSPGAITWGDPPPSLPPGSRLAVVSGDPTQTGPFVIRAQVPAGYKVPPHWHPTAEHLTVLSGTISLGMGEQYDQAAMTDVPAGGYAALPAEMRHSFLAKTAATFQVHGEGPFVVNYVNPADDPSKQTK